MEKKKYTTPFVEVHQLRMDAALMIVSAEDSSSITTSNTFDLGGYGGIDDEGTLDPD